MKLFLTTKIALAVASVSLSATILLTFVDTNLILHKMGAVLVLAGTVLPALAWANITFVL